jgi:phosphonate transport system substrate-binding protein
MFNKRSMYAVVSLFSLLAIVLSACQPAATPAPTAAPAQSTTAPTAPPPAPTAPPPNCAKLDGMPTAAAGTFGAPDKPLVITFVPSGDVKTLTPASSAIADCLSKLTGLTYNVEFGTSFGASIEAMGSGHAQFGFLNTFSILIAQAKYQIVPDLVALRNYKGKPVDYYQGQFIANNNAGIKSIADLKGKSFCFVDPNSTSGYVIPRIAMKANGIDPDKDLKATTNAGSHDNVAIAVYKGDCDAGSTFVDVRTDSAAVKSAYPDMLDKVSVFFLTDNIPNDGLQHVKDLDPKLVDATVNALMFMSNDPGGKAFLAKLYSYVGFEKYTAGFYDPFLALLQKAGVDPTTLVK